MDYSTEFWTIPDIYIQNKKVSFQIYEGKFILKPLKAN